MSVNLSKLCAFTPIKTVSFVFSVPCCTSSYPESVDFKRTVSIYGIFVSFVPAINTLGSSKLKVSAVQSPSAKARVVIVPKIIDRTRRKEIIRFDILVSFIFLPP